MSTEISKSLHELIDAVKTFEDADLDMVDGEEERIGRPQSMATDILAVCGARTREVSSLSSSHSLLLPPPPPQVHKQLAPVSRYFIGPQLAQHIEAIMQNSMAVAHVSGDRLREAILQLCSEVGVAGL